nr:unnamed protein product [Digitaria exilis]
MELKFKGPDYIMWKEEGTACDKDSGNGKDGSITVRNEYPQPPIPYLELPKGIDRKKVEELISERYLSIAKSIANDIIIPNPTPEGI